VTIHLKQFSEVPNVGDRIGGLIVEALTRRSVRLAGEAPLRVPNLIGAGSIAHWADERSWLWGCGLLARRMKLRRRPAAVLAVRGHLTRAALEAQGVACGGVVGDVGLLLPEVIAPAPKREHRLGVVPNYVDRQTRFVAKCRRDGVPVLDVHAAPEAFVEQLTSCDRIVSSSLHGIVLAHAYGLEAAWVALSRSVLGRGFKFHDYYSSLGIDAGEVRVMSPLRHSLRRMADACWAPARLPETAPLRDALRGATEALDV
jgi:pyruvyltransferase